MHNLIYSLAIGLLSVGCRKNQNNDPPPVDIQWNKIIIKDEIAVSSFYGDIDNEMIIGTTHNILKTTDKGATWVKVAQNVNSVQEFIVNGDSLLAISGWPNYYSLDNGNTWQVVSREILPNDLKQVVTSKNDIYKYVLNVDGENGLPSDVLLSGDNGTTWQNVFPYKHYIQGIHVDKADKVYLGVWGGITWKDERFFANNTQEAIIYYTKGR